MEKTVKIRDIKSIRILFIFDFVIISALLISFFVPGFFLPATCIFCPLLLICISLQLLLHFTPKGKVIFNSSGVTIITRYMNTIIYWNEVKCIYYNSFSEFFPLLNHFTVDLSIKIDDEIIDFDSKFGDIKVYKKDYLKIISFIPQYILDVNDFMVYRNILEKQKNEYKI